jgi:hypothetical protein
MNQPDLCRKLYLVQGLAWRAGHDLGQCDLAKPADGAPVLRRQICLAREQGDPFILPVHPPKKCGSIAARGRDSAMPAARVAVYRYR